jgi:hypothetical protein
MMKLVPFRLSPLVGLLGLGAIAGCTSTTPNWDAREGQSVRVLRGAQHLDPQAAAKNGSRQASLDGKAALESADRYVNSYREPPVQNIFFVGRAVTGGGNGAK